MSEITVIACRPGMKQQMEKAFAGMEVEVDDTLVGKDYEFRKRQMTMGEVLEAQISTAERDESDPKSAHTFVVPLVLNFNDDARQDIDNTTFAVVRTSSKDYGWTHVHSLIAEVDPTLNGDFPDFTVNVTATISALKAHLTKAGVKVYSVSEGRGITTLKE